MSTGVTVSGDGRTMRVRIGSYFQDLTPNEAYTLYGQIRAELCNLVQPLTDSNHEPHDPSAR